MPCIERRDLRDGRSDLRDLCSRPGLQRIVVRVQRNLVPRRLLQRKHVYTNRCDE
jgi:hypothetical protein